MANAKAKKAKGKGHSHPFIGLVHENGVDFKRVEEAAKSHQIKKAKIK